MVTVTVIGIKGFQSSNYAHTLHRSPETLITSTGQEDTDSSCARGGLGGHQEEFLH